MPLIGLNVINDADNNGQASIGDEYAIGEEHFYVINTNDTKVSMLAKNNLNVGYEYKDCNEQHECDITEMINPTGIQDENCKGNTSNVFFEEMKGVTYFSNDRYWSDNSYKTKPEYEDIYPNIYDSNSIIYPYVQSYVEYLKTNGAPDTITGRLMLIQEAIELGCDISTSNCDNAPQWVTSSTYWLGTAGGAYCVKGIASFSYSSTYSTLLDCPNHNMRNYGVRPVIDVLKKDM